MSHAVALRTSHPVVQSLVSRWISDARLDVAVHRGPGAAGSLTLDWRPGFGRAVLAPADTTAYVTIKEEWLERTNELLRAFLLTACILLVRAARTWWRLHTWAS